MVPRLKTRKKSQGKAEKAIAKSKVWSVDGSKYEGLFIELDENNKVTIQVDKDEKAHKQAKKGREWTTVSGSSVKASLESMNKKTSR